MGVQIPIIDIKGGENEVNKLTEACEKWGCFRIINHGISKELMVEMKSVTMDLFDCPMEIKRRTKFVLPGSGYNVALSQDYPTYQVLGLDISTPNCLSSFCSDLELSSYQRDILEKYNAAAQNLGTEILNKMAGITGKEDRVDAWVGHFRMNKYSMTPDTIGSCGLRTHTDVSIITILQDDDHVGGLEIVDSSGDLVDVDLLPGSFLINVGDLAVPWSNGKMKSVRHRVVCNDVGERVSIATTIITPSMNAEEDIEAHPNFLKGDCACKYGPFKHGEYRKLRHSANMYCDEMLDTFALE